MISKRNGFTLIELLVVIAIIGVLATIAMNSLNTARMKAKNSAFKSIARSVQAGISVCCTAPTSGNLVDPVNPGNEICDPALSSTYPANTDLGSVTVNRDCDDDDGFEVRLTPGSDNSTGGINYALCDRMGCKFF